MKCSDYKKNDWEKSFVWCYSLDFFDNFRVYDNDVFIKNGNKKLF